MLPRGKAGEKALKKAFICFHLLKEAYLAAAGLGGLFNNSGPSQLFKAMTGTATFPGGFCQAVLSRFTLTADSLEFLPRWAGWPRLADISCCLTLLFSRVQSFPQVQSHVTGGS